ncbi:MAG: DUF4375 domain-containing protein [Pirellulaceae bacterium]
MKNDDELVGFWKLELFDTGKGNRAGDCIWGFDGSTLREIGDDYISTYEYRADATCHPRTLDLQHLEYETNRRRAIYRLEAERLYVMCSDPSRDRPVSFEPPSRRSSYTSFVFVALPGSDPHSATDQWLRELYHREFGGSVTEHTFPNITLPPFMNFDREKEELVRTEVRRTSDKYNLRDAIDLRSHAVEESERIAVVLFAFVEDTANGGIEQYLANSSGCFAEETVGDLQSIGAVECARILEEALKMLPKGFSEMPQSRRRKILRELDRDSLGALDALTDRFNDRTEDIYALLVQEGMK